MEILLFLKEDSLKNNWQILLRQATLRKRWAYYMRTPQAFLFAFLEIYSILFQTLGVPPDQIKK